MVSPTDPKPTNPRCWWKVESQFFFSQKRSAFWFILISPSARCKKLEGDLSWFIPCFASHPWFYTQGLGTSLSPTAWVVPCGMPRNRPCRHWGCHRPTMPSAPPSKPCPRTFTAPCSVPWMLRTRTPRVCMFLALFNKENGYVWKWGIPPIIAI